MSSYSLNSHEITTTIMRKFLSASQLLSKEWTNCDMMDFNIGNAHRGTLMAQECPIDMVTLFSRFTAPNIESFATSECEYSLPNDPIIFQIPADEIDSIKSVLKYVYGDQVFSIVARATMVKEIMYMGENFQTEPFLFHNNTIIAKWLDADNKINIDYKGLRCGKIQTIMLVSVNCNERTDKHLLFKMKWYRMHAEPYKYGMHTQLYYDNTVTASASSNILPVYRVASKCVLCPMTINHTKCLLAIPVTGKWALV